MTRAEAKKARELRDSDWRWMLGHAQGRRILAEIIASSGLLQPVINDNALRMAHLEGRRSLGGEIYSRLTELSQGAAQTALLAEVLIPRDVRSSHDASPDDGDADTAAE